MAVSPNLVDEPLFTALSILTECLIEELGKSGGPDLCYAGQWQGITEPPPPLMNCSSGDCGVAWTTPVQMYASTNFPNPVEPGAMPCNAPMALEVQMGVLRCKPTGPSGYPDAQAVFTSNRLIMSDQLAMRKAALCCFTARIATHENFHIRNLRVTLGSWTPSALAAGGSWQVFIG